MFSHWIKTGLEVLPQSLLGKAIAYVLKRREGFRAVLKSPRLQLDNNLSERELRRVVVGRNYAEFVIMLSTWWLPSFSLLSYWLVIDKTVHNHRLSRN